MGLWQLKCCQCGFEETKWWNSKLRFCFKPSLIHWFCFKPSLIHWFSIQDCFKLNQVWTWQWILMQPLVRQLSMTNHKNTFHKYVWSTMVCYLLSELYCQPQQRHATFHYYDGERESSHVFTVGRSKYNCQDWHGTEIPAVSDGRQMVEQSQWPGGGAGHSSGWSCCQQCAVR